MEAFAKELEPSNYFEDLDADYIVGSISAALSGPVCIPPRAQAHFPKQRLVIEPNYIVESEIRVPEHPKDIFF